MRRLLYLVQAFVYSCNILIAQEPELILPVGHSSRDISFSFSGNGDYFLTADQNFGNTVKLWDSKTGRILKNYHIPNVDGIIVKFLSDDNYFIVIDKNQTAQLWNIAEDRCIKILKVIFSMTPGEKRFEPYLKTYQNILVDTVSPNTSVYISDSTSWDYLLLKYGGSLIKKNDRLITSFIDTSHSTVKAVMLDTITGNAFYKEWDYEKKIIVDSINIEDAFGRVGMCNNGNYLLYFSAKKRTHKDNEEELVSYSADFSITLRDINKKRGIRPEFIDMDQLTQVEFHPVRAELFLSSWNYNLYDWDIGNPENLRFEPGNSRQRLVDVGVKPFSISLSGLYRFKNNGNGTASLFMSDSMKLMRQTRKSNSAISKVIFSPDETTYAIAYDRDSTRVYTLKSGKEILSCEASIQLRSSQDLIAFSPDNRYLLVGSAGGALYDLKARELLYKFSKEIIISFQFSHDSKFIYTSHTDGKIRIWQTSPTRLLDSINMSGVEVNFIRLTPDGRNLIAVDENKSLKIWDLFLKQIWKEFKWTFNSLSKGIVISNDGNFFANILYGGKIFIYDLAQPSLRYEVNGNDCSFSKDNRLLAIMNNHSSCTIYSLFNLGELFTLYLTGHSDWLIVDTEGHYDGTANARKLLYYVCGRDVIELEQFKDLSWEPGLVSKIMGTNNEPITAKKLSEISICNFTPEVEERGFNNGVYQYQVTPRNGGVGEIQIYINGKQVKKYNPTLLPKKENTYLLAVNQKDIQDYFVSGRANEVLVKATTQDGTMASRGIIVTNTTMSKAIAVPNMYIVSIGISKYKGDALGLGYASKDAVDFSAVISAAGRKFLKTADGKEHITTYTFNTETGSLRWPSKEAIGKVMDSIAQKAKADDILLIFFAGHGVLQTGQENFYLVTAEATSFEQVMVVPKEVAISTGELNEWMCNIKANKQLLILDACNSGQVVQNIQELIAKRDVPADQQRALENLKDITGTYILSASASGQSAYETSLYGQGLLTYSLLAGIKLGDGLKDNKYIDVTKWFNASKTMVTMLAKDIGGRQDPQITGNASFAVGLVDKEITDGIQLSGKKKIFRRSNLVKEGIIPSDNLGLTALVDKELNEASVRGKESLLTYAADNTLLDAYSILGRYTVNGNNITVKVYLMKGIEEENILRQFKLSGTIDKKEELAGKIVQEIHRSLKD